MSRIYVVTPDATRREAIVEALKEGRRTSEIEGFGDVAHVELVRGSPVDLLVAHAGLRSREGQLVDLVLAAAARTPDARLLLLDDYLEESAARSASGAICWAPASATPEHIADIAGRILAGEAEFEGSLRELHFDDVVQLAMGTGYEGTLRVRSGRRSGTLSFHVGVPVSARLGEAERVEALATFLALDRGSLLALPYEFANTTPPETFTQEEIEAAYLRADELRASGELVDVEPDEVDEAEGEGSGASSGADLSFFDDDELAEFDAMEDFAAGGAASDGASDEAGSDPATHAEPTAPGDPVSPPAAAPSALRIEDLHAPPGGAASPSQPRASRLPTPALLADLGRAIEGTVALALVDVAGAAITAMWARNDASHRSVPQVVELVLSPLRAVSRPEVARSLVIHAWPHSIVVEFDGNHSALVAVVERPVLRTRLVAKLRGTLEAIQSNEATP